jgi:hypothetical protein
MNSGQVREGELKAEFDALESAFNATGIDFYVIGALARDICSLEATKNSPRREMSTLQYWWEHRKNING